MAPCHWRGPRGHGPGARPLNPVGVVMGEAHGVIPAGRLRHAQGQELEAGFPAIGESIGEKVARLGRWIHADVDPAANPPPHGLIDRGERMLVDPLPAATDGPEPVVEREPHEVEAELRDEPEVLLLEWPLGPFRGHHVWQIQSAPPRQMRGGGIRQGRGRARGGCLAASSHAAPHAMTTMSAECELLRIQLLMRRW